MIWCEQTLVILEHHVYKTIQVLLKRVIIYVHAAGVYMRLHWDGVFKIQSWLHTLRIRGKRIHRIPCTIKQNVWAKNTHTLPDKRTSDATKAGLSADICSVAQVNILGKDKTSTSLEQSLWVSSSQRNLILKEEWTLGRIFSNKASKMVMGMDGMVEQISILIMMMMQGDWQERAERDTRSHRSTCRRRRAFCVTCFFTLYNSHVCLQSSSEQKFQLTLLTLAQRYSFQTEAEQKVMERCLRAIGCSEGATIDKHRFAWKRTWGGVEGSIHWAFISCRILASHGVRVQEAEKQTKRSGHAGQLWHTGQEGKAGHFAPQQTADDFMPISNHQHFYLCTFTQKSVCHMSFGSPLLPFDVNCNQEILFRTNSFCNFKLLLSNTATSVDCRGNWN